jgi:hypothetical protein
VTTTTRSPYQRRLPENVRNREETRHYNLAIPESVFQEIERAADEELISVADLLRRMIKLGLTLRDKLQDPDNSLIMREGDQDKTIWMIF